MGIENYLLYLQKMIAHLLLWPVFMMIRGAIITVTMNKSRSASNPIRESWWNLTIHSNKRQDKCPVSLFFCPFNARHFRFFLDTSKLKTILALAPCLRSLCDVQFALVCFMFSNSLERNSWCHLLIGWVCCSKFDLGMRYVKALRYNHYDEKLRDMI